MTRLNIDSHELLNANKAKEEAYYERNRLVAFISKLFPACLGMHDISDTLWDAEWRNIVYIELPTGQVSWHLHDNDMIYFEHLKFDESVVWDGHTTEEKYRRMRDYRK